jgi:hypothetical protein
MDNAFCECGCGSIANIGKRFISGHNNKGRRKAPNIHSCQNCKKEFETRPYIKSRTYCSTDCRDQFRRKQTGASHPLYNREFLCPYATVTEVPQKDMLEKIGYTLVLTAITQDKAFINELLECPHVDRLNIGPISTMKISWDQPHEGNMFEFLYKRRSIDCV